MLQGADKLILSVFTLRVSLLILGEQLSELKKSDSRQKSGK